jgi:hypothetical protein
MKVLSKLCALAVVSYLLSIWFPFSRVSTDKFGGLENHTMEDPCEWCGYTWIGFSLDGAGIKVWMFLF